MPWRSSPVVVWQVLPSCIAIGAGIYGSGDEKGEVYLWIVNGVLLIILCFLAFSLAFVVSVFDRPLALLDLLLSPRLLSYPTTLSRSYLHFPRSRRVPGRTCSAHAWSLLNSCCYHLPGQFHTVQLLTQITLPPVSQS
ncbi:hypothetical protein BU23DRAFT_326753 [Bimuria novae-zelandiae CBS 107.79]|uniref:Uncharacterized protein n=1 Tax=Bimuria novae-zelandiae CBS 107.79 TaxID=1447943 RepID=A0A6A5UMA2_9PLEO|nr:hypothetical protein BU23DRAFT_326753 [Bimuria novae-zelandiae CBS 107.79]